MAFPFKCKRRGCAHLIIKDETQLTILMAELAALGRCQQVREREVDLLYEC